MGGCGRRAFRDSRDFRLLGPCFTHGLYGVLEEILGRTMALKKLGELKISHETHCPEVLDLNCLPTCTGEIFQQFSWSLLPVSGGMVGGRQRGRLLKQVPHPGKSPPGQKQRLYTWHQVLDKPLEMATPELMSLLFFLLDHKFLKVKDRFLVYMHVPCRT